MNKKIASLLMAASLMAVAGCAKKETPQDLPPPPVGAEGNTGAVTAPTGVQISGGVSMGSVSSPTSTRIVVTTATQAIVASTAVTITVTGLTVGVATGGSSNGINVATSADFLQNFLQTLFEITTVTRTSHKCAEIK